MESWLLMTRPVPNWFLLHYAAIAFIAMRFWIRCYGHPRPEPGGEAPVPFQVADALLIIGGLVLVVGSLLGAAFSVGERS
jgi:uncharacterized membrane protein SirB2